jgi:hypothetical protein
MGDRLTMEPFQHTSAYVTQTKRTLLFHSKIEESVHEKERKIGGKKSPFLGSSKIRFLKAVFNENT